MMKFIFGLQRNIEIFDNLILFFWVCIARNAQSTQNKLAYLCNISRKTCGMKLFFCLQVNTKVFYKVLAQSTKINKFAISLQYLRYCKDIANLLILVLWARNISRKTGRMKSIFCLQINSKISSD